MKHRTGLISVLDCLIIIRNCSAEACHAPLHQLPLTLFTTQYAFLVR